MLVTRPRPVRGVLPWLWIVGLALAVVPADAHQPSYSKGEYGTPQRAWPITDIDLSIVVYHQVTCDSPQLWLRFNAAAPRDIFFQLGVPAIDRLESYRPSLALLAPGLPPLAESVPFEVPEGMGGIIVHTHGVDEPEAFFEPFTQTESWILSEQTYSLPEAGEGYLVAWHPQRETGKLWVAVGDNEDFSNVDWVAAELWYENTQTFHETGDYAPEEVPEEEICPASEEAEPAPETGAPSTVTPTEEAGCAVARPPRADLLLVAWLLLFSWRQRRRADPRLTR